MCSLAFGCSLRSVAPAEALFSASSPLNEQYLSLRMNWKSTRVFLQCRLCPNVRNCPISRGVCYLPDLKSIMFSKTGHKPIKQIKNTHLSSQHRGGTGTRSHCVSRLAAPHSQSALLCLLSSPSHPLHRHRHTLAEMLLETSAEHVLSNPLNNNFNKQ